MTTNAAPETIVAARSRVGGAGNRTVGVTADGNGVTLNVRHIDARTGTVETVHPVVIGFGDAAELHAALGALLYANDYTAEPPLAQRAADTAERDAATGGGPGYSVS
jgi:hypothetical protein